MYIEIGEAPIYVNIKGSGEDALLLHGVPDCADVWDRVIDRIGHKYKCHAPDMPGMARSSMPKNYEFSFDHYADYIDSVVNKLGLKTPLTLIIHDWGGIFGLLWASKYPHKVKRIIGGDFPFSHLYKWHEWATIWRTPILGELSMLLMNWPVFKWELNRSSRRLTNNDMWNTYNGRVTQWRARAMVLKLYRSGNVDRFTRWESKQKELVSKVPFDIIWGADDPHVPTHQAKLMHPRSVTVIPNCGHWAPFEAPDEYCDVILNGPSEISMTKQTSRSAKPDKSKSKASKKYSVEKS